MEIMTRQFPDFKFYRMGDARYFKGWHITSTQGYPYELKLVLPAWYPDEMPRLYVIFPETLGKYDRGSINSEGVSHAFHTLCNGPRGCVQICHFKPEAWDASRTCVGVFFKGVLWLEAYDVHLITEMSIAQILDQWKRRQKWGERKTEFDRLLKTWPGGKILTTNWSMTP